MMKLNIVILAAGFCMLVNPVAGKKCYDCLGQAECNDEFIVGATTDGFKKDCTGSCIKNKDEDNNVVHRWCSPVTVNAGCIDQSFDGNEGKSCACSGDSCNGAGFVGLPVITCLLLLIVSLIFYLNN